MDSSSLCYKDGPQLPPLNFTTTCFTSGRYVIFYNERLDETTYPEGYELLAYTELCEVIVQGRKKLMLLVYILHDHRNRNFREDLILVLIKKIISFEPCYNFLSGLYVIFFNRRYLIFALFD